MPRRQNDTEREIASSPYPIMPLRPKGVRYRGEGRINYDALRAQMKTPPPTRPTTPPSSRAFQATPPRKRNPEDLMFIKKPSPSSSSLKSPSERMRCVSSPYASPSRPSGVARRLFSGPAPGIKNLKVPQNNIYPPRLRANERADYSGEDTVHLGTYAHVGCCVGAPDAVSTEPLNLPSAHIVICFQWKGYEAYGVFSARVDIPKFRQKPFDSRRDILKEVKKLFLDFRGKVAHRRRAGEDTSRPAVDVLAFGDNDIRVTRLEKRSEMTYQVIFTYPARVED
ncbi:hypothetical protein ACEPAF_8180 [Sanghuangporus sanghuang]